MRSALYIVYGSDDGAWNEIDIGMINNALNQLEVRTAHRDAAASMHSACTHAHSLADAPFAHTSFLPPVSSTPPCSPPTRPTRLRR